MQNSYLCYVEFCSSKGVFVRFNATSKNLTQCSTLPQHHLDGCGNFFSEGKKSDDDLHSINSSRNYSELSTSSTMSQNFTPTIVYQRRRHHKQSVAFFTIQSCAGTKPSDVCNSAISSEAPAMAAQDNMISVSDRAAENTVRSPSTVSVEYNWMAATSSNGYHAGEETGSEEALVTNMDRGLNVNGNCSSTRSNLERRALIDDVAPGELSKRDRCISIRMGPGLLYKAWTRQDRGFRAENSGACSDNYCSKPCKVCEKIESTKNMLICDNCQNAFHVTCYNPRITVIPIGEWLCGSCLKDKHNIVKDKLSSNSVNVSDDIARDGCSASKGELGEIARDGCSSSEGELGDIARDGCSSSECELGDIARDGCSASECELGEMARDGCSASEGELGEIARDGCSSSKGELGEMARDGCSALGGELGEIARDGCSASECELGDIARDGCSASEGELGDIARDGCSASEGEIGSLEFMFRDPEPYMSNVRIGDEFQADVSDWRGPIDEECDLVDEPLEMDPCNNLNTQELDSIKTLKCGSIGNWLQCRAVIEDVGEGGDGTMCAKWRRAPLFEVQTDAWECFNCVHWDPAHADCAVPQELGTEEVMKQLKYVEMLRPQLSKRKRKLDHSKSSNY